MRYDVQVRIHLAYFVLAIFTLCTIEYGAILWCTFLYVVYATTIAPALCTLAY